MDDDDSSSSESDSESGDSLDDIDCAFQKKNKSNISGVQVGRNIMSSPDLF